MRQFFLTVDNAVPNPETYLMPLATSAKQRRSCSLKQSLERRLLRRARTKRSLATRSQPDPEHRSPEHTCSPASASTRSSPQPISFESRPPKSHVLLHFDFSTASPVPSDSVAKY